jgi:hypothetical protein
MATLAIFGTLMCAGAPSAREQPTAVHLYVAFKAGRLTPGLTVSASVRGSCWSPSGILTRRYAWRCFKGHGIYDPCFSATPRGHVVACPERPWSKRVLLMRLTRSLTRWEDYKSRWYVPWGIWTSSGKRCFKLSHWQSEVAGKRVTHYCVGGGVLAGFADRRRPTWRIYYAPSLRSKRVILVGISDAWT